MQEKVYDVALSFANEDRKYVEQVAVALREKGIKVFYDSFEEAKLWGKDLYVYLQDIYQNQAVITVMFISEHYARKVWTNHERASAQARAYRESQEYILPARFDGTDVPGVLSTTGYIDLSHRSPTELARLIVEKLGYLQDKNSSSLPSTTISSGLDNQSSSLASTQEETLTNSASNPLSSPDTWVLGAVSLFLAALWLVQNQDMESLIGRCARSGRRAA